MTEPVPPVRTHQHASENKRPLPGDGLQYLITLISEAKNHLYSIARDPRPRADLSLSVAVAEWMRFRQTLLDRYGTAEEFRTRAVIDVVQLLLIKHPSICLEQLQIVDAAANSLMDVLDFVEFENGNALVEGQCCSLHQIDEELGEDLYRLRVFRVWAGFPDRPLASGTQGANVGATVLPSPTTFPVSCPDTITLLSVTEEVVREAATEDRNTVTASPLPTPRWQTWAIGLELGNKWHVFRNYRGEWRQQKLLKGISRGRQSNLLAALAERGGRLPKVEALKLERSNYSAGDVDKLMLRIKPELARLRDKIRNAIGVADSKANPLPFHNVQQAWRAEFEIGYAVQEDGDCIGGECRLRFKTRTELTRDEAADR